MVFSSLLFLFLYLPTVLALYYVCPRRWRNLLLFVVNLVFYGWGEPVFVTLMIFSTAVDYTCGRFISKYRKTDKKKAKRFLIASVIINLSLLGFFKYAGFLTDTLNYLPFLNIPSLKVPLPIGISFYTFQTMSYSIDVYRGDAPMQKNIITFGTYVSLFPQLIAGPIVRYKDVAYQLDHRRETLDSFTNGVCLFCVGLAKKVLIANQMGALWDSLRDTGETGWIGSWVGIIAYSFQIYFDFSGYSDMACGLGNMLGFEFLKNFNYPYISKSITEFWRRWHISLGTWFREYVYIPLGGNRKGVPRQMLNLLIVWFLTGLWHGADFNFIFWGLYFGFLLVLEKFVLKRLLDKAPAAVQHLYALFFIILGWVLFYFSDLGEMGAFFLSLFRFGGTALTHDAGVLALSYLPMLLAAAVASTPLASKLWLRIADAKAAPALKSLFCIVVLALCTALLVLYFRF